MILDKQKLIKGDILGKYESIPDRNTKRVYIEKDAPDNLILDYQEDIIIEAYSGNISSGTFKIYSGR